MADTPDGRGTLDWLPATEHLDLLADPVAAALGAVPGLEVSEIDPELADTAAFCERYRSAPELSANCVVVAGRRGDLTRYAAVVILATTRADVNKAVRKFLDVRKCSFAPMDDAVRLSAMEYGGITPVGLPADWPVLVDERVADAPASVVIGSGLRRSKCLVPPDELIALPGAEVGPFSG
ncbi:YbaK/EbsC family protein [Flexivirga oryzae]|uniref:Prolyl-tRNA editing enzyme YbaK/EbsC (Cys-tRNA(Pro) deacylase) n=1 Tax=Flexivirga oryzae TaxID=1794944 RepID=A0A839NCF2_9MICO|nr:YbaK/EbsC family protein [Flexivirga oryzae]MBB2892865.1 prolyl-tRNA editing enzyme YbaK/EbsC (Cys-tRNA(Pro) deacylase) [Flexivirga oryzae]